MMGGNNDNETPEEADGKVVSLATHRPATMRGLIKAIDANDHAEGERHLAELEKDAESLWMHAIDLTDGDYEGASIMLMRAVQITDREALIDRAERLLGPRRYGPDNPPPVAA